jgi:hydrogenase expression/formation protein HypC
MCIAMPGKVLSIANGRARVDFYGNVVEADMRLVDAKEGDYVLIHAGIAIEVMKKTQAEELSALFRDIEEEYDH